MCAAYHAPLVIALAICIGLSYAAVKIGMAAIIGAFFAGLVQYSPRWNLQPRVPAINEFLAPFFFFSMGSRLNLAVFDRKLVLSRHCYLVAGDHLQTGRLRIAGFALGLEACVESWHRYGAAR